MKQTKYKVWDKQNKEFWPDIFTVEALAKSHRFPENLEDFYEIIPLKQALEIETIRENFHCVYKNNTLCNSNSHLDN